MSRKSLWVLLVVAGLAGYGAYIFTILRPYFVQVELETAWELDYSSIPFNQLHLGRGGTIFLTTDVMTFIAVSPAGKELYRYKPSSEFYSYGYDDGTDDTLWVATMDYVDPSKLPQAQQYPGSQPPAKAPAEPVAKTTGQAPFVARLVGLDLAGDKLVDKTIEVDGVIRNLWCLDGKVVFKDIVQGLYCFDEQGNQLWAKDFLKMVDFCRGDGNLLFLDLGSSVAAVDLEGNQIWEKVLGRGAGFGDWHDWSSSKGRICILDNYDRFHVIDFAGQELWTQEIAYSSNPFGGFSYGDPAVKIHHDHSVYAISRDTILTKYSHDGSKLWNFKVGSNSSRFELDADGTVYLQCQDKGLLAISSEGKLLWRDERFIVGDIPPKVGMNGLLYIEQNSKLIALRIPEN